MSLVSVADFEQKANGQLEPNALDYYRSGAGEQVTLNLNRQAYKRLRLRPRCLRDVSKLDASCEILGEHLNWPLGIAPTAMQKLAHPDGEIGSARAAGKAGSIFILSTLSTTSLEDVAAAAPDTCKWFQLYIYRDRCLTEELVRRAERANFKALVLTVDTPINGDRRADARNHLSLPSHLTLANFKAECTQGFVSKCGGSGLNEYVACNYDPSISWQDVKWLQQLTHLPIVLKGILSAEDALLARDIGCAGLIVSNHGGRQLDTTPASIEVLPEIVAAVGKDMVVMMDGGIMQGIDIFKALALGAQTVFIGRPTLWGLAANGQRGVEQLLTILKRDFEVTMTLTGCPTLADIRPAMVVHESAYWQHN
ncbi:peroxisomal (S)-2-hydroxy-acid oxidase GLO3 [Drosophila grimshawi]|uniref:(S)-2-hydroxy-acid oxidase n=1 Tax=Drosophila grimshawi TaxID=7222 RepID=B4J6Y5_DROGR|nr:peroxisomal (S)-2-hydroxy-acid oxidase GLO3 [Drosophila grimshawi]EDW02066.1 GH21788 [Drosophila grimshawi]